MQDLDIKSYFDVSYQSHLSGQLLLQKLTKFLSERTIVGPPVFIVDLDGTIFDNNPRQIAVYRQLQIKYPILRSLIPEEKLFLVPFPYSILTIIQNHLSAISYPQIDSLMKKLTRDFYRMFLTNRYLAYDIPFEGAAEILQEMTKRGIHVWYLTGRSQRSMQSGTLMSLKLAGFPLPKKNSTVSLIMKPKKTMNDDQFRKIVFESVPPSRKESILGYIDNEAELCMIAAEYFPSALVVHFHSTQAKQIPISSHWMDRWA